MKIAAFLVVGTGEADRWLEMVLKQLRWADTICVCLNRADEATKALVYRYAKFVREDDREWGREQWRIKQDFLNAVLAEVQPDWIWCLDSDEVFDPRFDRAMAEKMASGHDVAWYFWCLQLWNDDTHVRMDLSFPNVRFFKVVPELGMHFLAQALHCGLAPMYAYQYGSQSGLYFKHYGLMKREDRLRKIARYDLYDPNAKYKGKSWYDGLRNERATSIPIEEAILRIPEFIHRKKPVRASKDMKRDKSVFLFVNKAGKTVTAVGEKQREEFTKRGFRTLDMKVNPNPEAPVVPKTPVEPVKEAEAPVKTPEAKEDASENMGASAESGASAGAAPKRKSTRKKA